VSAAGVASASLVRRRPPVAVRRRRFLLSVANHSLLIVVAAMFLAPFVFMLLTALMSNGQALSSDLWPHPFRWRNFVDVFRQAPIWRWALNTLLYSGLATPRGWPRSVCCSRASRLPTRSRGCAGVDARPSS
jgi:multiple sugar transport system permease protein